MTSLGSKGGIAIRSFLFLPLDSRGSTIGREAVGVDTVVGFDSSTTRRSTLDSLSTTSAQMVSVAAAFPRLLASS
jgi:hypothetical protein